MNTPCQAENKNNCIGTLSLFFWTCTVRAWGVERESPEKEAPDPLWEEPGGKTGHAGWTAQPEVGWMDSNTSGPASQVPKVKRAPLRLRYAVTLEFSEEAPETVRGEFTGANACLGARRAVEAAFRAHPRRRWSNLSVLLERQGGGEV